MKFLKKGYTNVELRHRQIHIDIQDRMVIRQASLPLPLGSSNAALKHFRCFSGWTSSYRRRYQYKIFRQVSLIYFPLSLGDGHTALHKKRFSYAYWDTMVKGWHPMKFFEIWLWSWRSSTKMNRTSIDMEKPFVKEKVALLYF